MSSHLQRDGPVVSHSPAEVDFATMVAHNRTKACFYTIQEGKVLPWSTRAPEPIDFANPSEQLAGYAARELVRRAKEPKRESIPPTVCVHGRKDLMVPFALSEELVETLREAGVDAQLIEEPEANQCVSASLCFDPLSLAGIELNLTLGCTHASRLLRSGFDLLPGTWGDKERMRVFEQANDFLAKYLE